MRLFVACLVSSLVVVPLYFVLMALSGDLDNGLLIPMLLASSAVSAMAVFFFALPLHLLLLRLDSARAHYYLLVGFLVPASITFAINPFGADVASWIKWQALAMGIMGACVAGTFWKIATGESTD